MAETDTEPVPNGTGGLSAEEDDERLKQRPADIDADVREMERRKRVEAIMSSKLFREELERVLDQQLNEGGGAAPLLQRIREMVGGAGAARLQAGAFKGGVCVLPINDIRGIEGMGYEKGEKILRCKLAAVYRLVDLYGWTQGGLSGQITARLNTADEHFLTAARGLLPHEVTASSLVKVDMQGAVQDQGTTNFPINLTGFALHASVHAARPDVRCVLHVRSPAALAVSAQRDGLLPLCSEAALLGDLAYHHLPPGVLDNEERDKLVRALGPTAKLLVLSNGGALCCGETLEEAFYQAKCLTAACDVQLRLAAVPRDSLNLLDDETRKQIYDASRRAPADGVKWRVGGEEFEALMRMLDNAGYRTGYIYRHPLVKGDVPRPKCDVEVPPAVSSLGYLLEEEELYRQGLWKKMDGRKTGDRTRWLNSPNVYQKVEVLETGTTDPKKITKWVDANNEEWVQDGSPAHSSTPVKIDAALQFVPKNTNPKEFKALQQQIKENRRADKISAGPQSHILEGVTWDEANKLNEDAAATHTGDHVVLMGAASKGIIQRGYQHNATVYSAPYARNPFDSVSDRELDEYKRTVERKARGEYDADVSESEGVSAAQLTSPDCQPSETEEESRDDHRILRIETKHAPKPSQPEVVLSDDSTTDFLANERRAAEHTARGDSALFSDDEVFLEGRASSSAAPAADEASAAARVRVGGGVLADGGVIVRSYKAPLQQDVVKDNQDLTKHDFKNASSAQEPVFVTSQRSRHRYSRSPNFRNVVKMFESPESEKSVSPRKSLRPKCRKSLILSENNDGPEIIFRSYSSDRSSGLSNWSLDWDSRKDQWLRTRSLPRPKTHKTNLYRTRSHSGFVSTLDPEPMHFHLPRCRSCDAYNVNYAWEIASRRLMQKEELDETLRPSRSMGNISKDRTDNTAHAKVEIPKPNLGENTSLVKVKTSCVPLLKALKMHFADTKTEEHEFLESQEFSDDGYLDTGGSFSSENLTVIENVATNATVHDIIQSMPFDFEGGDDNEDVEDKTDDARDTDDSVAAEFDSASDRADEELTEDLNSGAYINYSDEMFDDKTYESPVKDLVQKDIRDYSVPMKVYCDDFSRFVQITSPRRSPTKTKSTTVPATVLEPILEESKSSYGEESTASTSNTNNATDENSMKYGANKASESIQSSTKDSLNAIETKVMHSEAIIDIVSIVDNIVMNSVTVKNQKENATLECNNIKINHLESSSNADDVVVMTTEQCTSDSEENHTVKDLIMETFAQRAIEEEIAIYADSKNVVHKSIEKDETQDCVFKVPKEPEIRSDYTSSTIRDSFDSVSEFEGIEIVSDVIGSLLDRASEENQKREENEEFLNIVSRHKFKTAEILEVQNKDENRQVDLKETTEACKLANGNNGMDTNEIELCNVEYSNMKVMTHDYNERSESANEFDNTDEAEICILAHAELVDTVEDVINDDMMEISFSEPEVIEDKLEKEALGEQQTQVDLKETTEACKFANGNNGMDTNEIELCNAEYSNMKDMTNDYDERSESGKKFDNTDEAEICIFAHAELVDTVEDVISDDTPEIGFSEHEIIEDNLEKETLGEEHTDKIKEVMENICCDENTNVDADISKDDNVLVVDYSDQEVMEVKSVQEDVELMNAGESKDICIDADAQNEDIQLEIDHEIVEVSAVRNGETTYTQSCSQDLKVATVIEETESNINISEHVIQETAQIGFNETFQLSDDEEGDSLDAIEEFLAQNKPKQCGTTFIISAGTGVPLLEETNAESILQESSSNSQKDAVIEPDSQFQIQEFVQTSTYIDTDENGNYARHIVQYILEIIVDSSIAQYNNISNTDLDTNASKVSRDEDFMDVAFVESSYHESITSSPINQSFVHKIDLNESPIKYETPRNSNNSFESPFVKRTPILTMSHREQKGGITFWVSFSDCEYQCEDDMKRYRRLENLDDKTPSFLCTDFSVDEPNTANSNDSANFTADSLETIPDFKTDSEVPEFFKDVRTLRSVLCREVSKSLGDPQGLTSDSFETALASGSGTFVSCASALNRDDSRELAVASDGLEDLIEIKSRHVKKVYDSSKTGRLKRGSSWPPFEDTLFYRILSKFRMSESFDPNEFEKLCQ